MIRAILETSFNPRNLGYREFGTDHRLTCETPHDTGAEDLVLVAETATEHRHAVTEIYVDL